MPTKINLVRLAQINSEEKKQNSRDNFKTEADNQFFLLPVHLCVAHHSLLHLLPNLFIRDYI